MTPRRCWPRPSTSSPALKKAASSTWDWKIAGSIRAMTFSRAMIDAYSVPCAPDTSASTGPKDRVDVFVSELDGRDAVELVRGQP